MSYPADPSDSPATSEQPPSSPPVQPDASVTSASPAPYPSYPAAPAAAPPSPYPYPAQPYPGAPAYPAAPGYAAPQPSAPYPYVYVPVPVGPAGSPIPYASAPAGPVPGKRRRPGYLIAAIGCAVTLIAYFGLPFFVFSFSASGISPSANFGLSYAVTASQLTSTPLNLFSTGASAGSALIGLFWLVPVLAILGLIATVALPFTSLTANRSAHVLTAIVFQLGAAGVAAIVLVGALQLRDQLDSTFDSLNGLSGTNSSLGYSLDLSYGLYVLLSGLALVLIGGILVLARGDRRAPAAA